MRKAFTPTDIARETLRLLAERHLAPTPDNYRRVFNEIAGLSAEDASKDAEHRLRQVIGGILESTAGMYLSPHADLAEKAHALARRAHALDDAEATTQFAAGLDEFLLELEKRAARAAALQHGLVRLLQLLLEGVRELMIDDPRLNAQIAVLERAAADPLGIQDIEETERSLNELMLKQGALKRSLIEVENTLKHMVSRFMAAYSEQISRTEDPAELSRLLNEVMGETRMTQMSARSSRDESIAAPGKVEAAEARIRQLENDLAQVSAMVREDQLTGALNRRGLDDAFAREAARADRHRSSLSLALLDIDNFKQLNDAYGHQAGDGALAHLAQIIKDTVRPDDVVTRFGGEEFLILLPDAGLDQALDVILRLQRAVARRHFLHKDERLLINFSSGVAQRASGETKEALIERADKALYRAKRAGKNRVVAAVSQLPPG